MLRVNNNYIVGSKSLHIGMYHSLSWRILETRSMRMAWTCIDILEGKAKCASSAQRCMDMKVLVY